MPPPHWEKEYKERLGTMERWAPVNEQAPTPQEEIIRHHLPFFEHMARKALKKLGKSAYEEYLNGRTAVKTLVHGDFHQNNLIGHSGEWVLIDFEDVRYDLPSKDLLRLYSMYTRKHPFDKKTFRSMAETYLRCHPLPAEVEQLIYIDFLFPHIFERTLRKMEYVRMHPKVLQYRISQEKDKAMYVSSILTENVGSKLRR